MCVRACVRVCVCVSVCHAFFVVWMFHAACILRRVGVLCGMRTFLRSAKPGEHSMMTDIIAARMRSFTMFVLSASARQLEEKERYFTLTETATTTKQGASLTWWPGTCPALNWHRPTARHHSQAVRWHWWWWRWWWWCLMIPLLAQTAAC